MSDVNNVRLTKLSTNKNALRTNVVEGTAFCMPVIGARFDMYSEALDIPGGVRLISTSQVTYIAGDTFTTRSGTVYKLEILPSKETT